MKGTRKVGGAGKNVFALFQFSEPDYFGARNRLRLKLIRSFIGIQFFFFVTLVFASKIKKDNDFGSGSLPV